MTAAAALSLFPLQSLSLSRVRVLQSHGSISSQTQRQRGVLSSNPKLLSSIVTILRLQPSSTFPNKKTLLVLATGNSSDPENGAAVDDMDGYLNYLSLEYDSVWDTKPSWCQPWTITLTGVLIIACSWLILHSVVVTMVVLSLICAWWYIFLYNYPKAYSDMIAERRKKVTNGVEDTFGLRKSQ